jgi:hypothetical protein
VESLQEFAAATDHLAHRDQTELPEHLISTAVARAFADRITERNIRPQVHFRSKKALLEAINQALELEADDIATESLSRVS